MIKKKQSESSSQRRPGKRMASIKSNQGRGGAAFIGGQDRKAKRVPPPKELKYVALYKPFDVLSQFTGEAEQRTLRELNLPVGVYAAGRLDRDSEGLLLLSNDGPFIDRLINPKNAHDRSYLVQVEKVPDEQALTQLRAGVTIKGYKTRPCEVELLSSEPDLPPRNPPIRERKNIPTAWLRMTLREGKNRQVRRMTAAVGFPTLRLVRESIGKLQLGKLVPGEWREVRQQDIL